MILERDPVNLRYSRELRDSIQDLREILVPTPTGSQVPIGYLAKIEVKKGAPSIKTENSRPNAWIYVDISDVDVGTYAAMAQRAVAGSVEIPVGYNIVWSGQYEYMQRAEKRLKDLVDAIYQRAVYCVRPKIMTASMILAGLLPIMWSHGTGADVMKRIAAPMVGGVGTSVIMKLGVYPVIYYIWKGWKLSDAASESTHETA